ncbi:MAG TPA: hypothetical protein GX497_16425 [Bacillus bacterium]|nr:hypothetical protein [Bacillus sp. (in: firmicutes)]
MEFFILLIIIFTFAIFWSLLDDEENEYRYEPIDRIENAEKAVFVFKKRKIKDSNN